MNLKTRLSLAVVGLLLAGGFFLFRELQTQAAPIAEQLSDKDATDARKVILPRKGEDEFARIPWLTSIWDARIQAAKEGKPILLWEMDGHPLGCG